MHKISWGSYCQFLIRMLSSMVLNVDLNSLTEMLQKTSIRQSEMLWGTFWDMIKCLCVLYLADCFNDVFSLNGSDLESRQLQSQSMNSFFSVGGDHIHHNLKEQRSTFSRSGMFMVFSNTFFFSSSSQDCSKNISDHSRFWIWQSFP